MNRIGQMPPVTVLSWSTPSPSITMNSYSQSVAAACALFIGAFPSFPAQAGPVGGGSKDKVALEEVPKPATQSRWSIGAGLTYRQIDADFDIRPVGRPLSFHRDPSGRGDVGLFLGGDGIKSYNDGSVGPDYEGGDGSAYTVINSPGQLTDTGRITDFEVVADGQVPIYNVAFHTSYAESSEQYGGRPYHDSDTDDAFGPYVELRYAAYQGSDLSVNLMLGYSYISGDLGSDKGLLATESVDRTSSRYTYNYDYDAVNAGALGASYPFVDGAYSIIDPDGSYAQGAGFQAPHKSSNSSTGRIASYYEVGQAQLDVDLHEIVLAPEIAFQTGILHVGLSVGPTLNFVNTDFDASASWYRTGSSHAVKTYHVSESKSDVELGVMGQISLQVDVTKNIFLQGSASYRYVPTVDTAAAFASSQLDLSSFSGSAGLGVRF